MTVIVETERHVHHPTVYIPDSTNIVSLYTLSHLLRSSENFRIHFQAENLLEEDLVKRVCPRAIKENGPVVKGMERSVVYLKSGMSLDDLKAPVEGYHRFVLIVSMAGAEDPIRFPFSESFAKLEQAARNAGYSSYCILRLPPIYQHFQSIESENLEFEGGAVLCGIDADDVGSAISHILIDPDLHRGEEYTIFSPSSISPSLIKTVHSQLPRVRGEPFQPTKTIIESIKAKYWQHLMDSSHQGNNFASITGGEEMTSFDEFLRRSSHSLFHQRFLTR